jgi:RNA polymerase sigma-70 factor (ECF subfamily)
VTQPSEPATARQPARIDPEPSRDRREEFVRTLHSSHGHALLGFVLSELHGDRAAAEDIVQETMLRAWQHADQAGSLSAPRAWLFTIAHRLVIDRWRSLNARPREVTDEQLRHVGIRDPSEDMLSGIVIREAMAALTAKHRVVLVDIYLRGRSVADTARVLGLPPGTVKSRLNKALHALRVALEAKGALEVG